MDRTTSAAIATGSKATNALQEAGIEVDPRRMVDSDFKEEGGASAMAALLAGDPRLDAVFAANDVMAFGAMRALRSAGRRVPDDVAVVGFDDIPSSPMSHPPLTTVRQPLYEMGRTAATLVMAAGRDDSNAKRIELHTTLVIRDSSSGTPSRDAPRQVKPASGRTRRH